MGQSYFYADGNEDAALMKLVGHPRPVNPRAGLAAMATTHGWPVLHVGAPGQRGPANALGHLPGLGRAAIGAAFGAVVARGNRRRCRASHGAVRDVGHQTAVDDILRTSRER